jgi:N-acetylglucosamine-6-phosphate deacetylase
MSVTTVLSDVQLTSRPDRVDLHLSQGRIASIQAAGSEVPSGSRKIDARGLTAVPGFIDLHIHGALGFDFMDATEEAYRKIGEYHASGGTTSYMPTTATESPEAIFSCIDMASRSREQRLGGVEILGVHVEGPYMAPTKHGCHDPGYVRRPSKEENRGFLDRAAIIRRMTLAPEVPGVQDFIRDLSRHGVIPSGGHSEATLDQTSEAIGNGMRMITHLYCAMSTITKKGPYRIPGMLEATLLDDRLATELIADLKHVSRELLLLALKAKAERSICFVTDAMRGAGMPDGTYTFGSARGTKTIVENGVARNLENTGFASSTVRMIDLLRNAVESMGLDLETAVRRSSLIPATIAGVADRKGSLGPGKDADIVLLETAPRLEVRMTLGRGEVLYDSTRS